MYTNKGKIPNANTIRTGPERSGSSRYSESHLENSNTLIILYFISNGDVMSKSTLLK